MTRRAIFLSFALAAAACSGGHHSHKSPVSLPAPANLVAVGGFHTVSLTWSPVSGATSYDLFRVLNEDVPGVQADGTPIAVTGTSFTVTGLRNWIPTSWRVAAVVGGATGARSLRAMATPSAGYLVGFRENPGAQQAARFRSDVTDDAPADLVAGAIKTATLGTSGVVVYQVPSSQPYSEVGLFATGGTRVPIGNTAGHSYRYIGFTATGRWIYWDLSAGLYDIRSNDFTGSDDRLLLAGCNASPVTRVSPKGVLVTCTVGASTDPIWATDGVAPAVNLTGSAGFGGLDYFPAGVILSKAGILYRADADGGTAPAQLSPDPTSTGDTYYTGMTGTSDHVILSSHVGAVFKIYSMGANGSQSFTGKSSGSIASMPFPDMVSADRTHFLAVLPNAAGTANTYAYRFSYFDTEVVQLTPSGTSDAEAHFLPDGSMLVRATGQKWRYFPPTATTSTDGVTINSVGATTSSFLGARGPWILFNDQSGVTNLVSVNQDMVHVATLNMAVPSNPHFVWGATDFAFIDAAGAVHVATIDGSRSAVLDATPSSGVEPSGVTPDGRELWIVTHTAGPEKDTLVLDPAAGTAQTILGGATSDAGWFVP